MAGARPGLDQRQFRYRPNHGFDWLFDGPGLARQGDVRPIRPALAARSPPRPGHPRACARGHQCRRLPGQPEPEHSRSWPVPEPGQLDREFGRRYGRTTSITRSRSAFVTGPRKASVIMQIARRCATTAGAPDRGAGGAQQFAADGLMGPKREEDPSSGGLPVGLRHPSRASAPCPSVSSKRPCSARSTA